MNLTSEHVHWLGGAAVVIVATALLLREAAILSAAWIAWLLPIFFALYGVESLVDPWVHGAAAPANYGAETTQHVVQGSAMLVAGVIEGLVLRGTLTTRAWSAAIPIALAVVAVVFLIHAHHTAPVSALVIKVQHRAFALTLLLAAGVRMLAMMPGDAARRLAPGWLFLFLLFGLEMLTYTESPPGDASHGEH
jgi:hypothetical protein